MAGDSNSISDIKRSLESGSAGGAVVVLLHRINGALAVFLGISKEDEDEDRAERIRSFVKKEVCFHLNEMGKQLEAAVDSTKE